MALSTKTLKVLEEAGVTVSDVVVMPDDELLGVPGVGPAVFRDIRREYAAPVDPDPGQPEMPAVAPPAVRPEVVPEPPAAPACTCSQPWRVTRTRRIGGRLERYCDTCGAIQGAR